MTRKKKESRDTLPPLESERPTLQNVEVADAVAPPHEANEPTEENLQRFQEILDRMRLQTIEAGRNIDG